MILKCDCKHKDQDKLHGTGNRVHNLCKENKYARCTVCGSTKLIAGNKWNEEKYNIKLYSVVLIVAIYSI